MSSPTDDQLLRQAKRVLRKAVLQRRRVRPVEERRADDHARFEIVRDHLDADLGVVGCYLSVDDEPSTLELIGWLAASGVRVLLPVITPAAGDDQPFGDPAWAPYEGPDRLRTHDLGLIEPTSTTLPASAIHDATLIILPALAANDHGDRLGRGGGWYDRALIEATPQTRLVALLNDEEVMPAIPNQSWDRRVTQIATASRWIDCEPA